MGLSFLIKFLDFWAKSLQPTAFTEEEAEKLKGALLDLSDRIRRAADNI